MTRSGKCAAQVNHRIALQNLPARVSRRSLTGSTNRGPYASHYATETLYPCTALTYEAVRRQARTVPV